MGKIAALTVMGASLSTGGYAIYSSLETCLRGRGIEAGFLSGLLRDGNSKLWSAATQLNFSPESNAANVANAMVNTFIEKCSYMTGRITVQVHSYFCDAVRDAINSTPNDPYNIGLAIGVAGMLVGVFGTTIGFALRKI